MKKNTLFAFLILLASCNKEEGVPAGHPGDYKQAMRDFVIGISKYGRQADADFIIIPQNGIELVSKDGNDETQPHTEYLSAIDANGQEDLLYGYDGDNQATSLSDTEYLQGFLNLSKASGKAILAIDYCSTESKMIDSYNRNKSTGYISFAANHRELNNIPSFPSPIYQESSLAINSINEAGNFLYLINLENYSSKTDFINAVKATNYDVLIMDLFFNDGEEFTSSEINQLRWKANGGKRLVISYMSIGEAEDYRYYWNTDWNSSKPVWLDAVNPDWPGNYKVNYWNADWQKIIYGSNDSYLKKILDAGFDGVYLDIIDAFEYYEH